MLYETLNQPLILLILLLSGFLSGIIFDVFKPFKSVKRWKWIGECLDFIAIVFVFVIFYLVVLFSNFGELRLYQFIIFFGALIIERITIGKLVAKVFKICYNFFIKLFRKGVVKVAGAFKGKNFDKKYD